MFFSIIRSLVFCAAATTFGAAQTAVTITRNDSSVKVAAPVKPGENTGTVNVDDNGDIFKNILRPANAGFEPRHIRGVYTQNIVAAANQVVIPPFYLNGNFTSYPANMWANAVVDITAVTSPWTGPELGCHATVASNPIYSGIGGTHAVTSFSISGGLVTLGITSTSYTYQAGEVLAVSGLSNGTYLNGILITVTSATSTSIVAALPTGFTPTSVSATTDSGSIVGQDVVNLSSACGGLTQVGDVFTLYLPPVTTPESVWESGAVVSNGATITSDTATPYDGAQSIVVDTTAGSNATIQFSSYFDNDAHDRWHDMSHGSYALTVAMKRVTGTSPITVTAQRGSAPIFCTMSLNPTGTAWGLITATCNPTESASATAGLVVMKFSVPALQKIEIDDEDFERKDGRNVVNITPFLDEVINAECDFDGGCSPTVWGMGREWEGQQGETFASWTATATTAPQAQTGDPNNFETYFNIPTLIRLPEALKRYQYEHRIPYIAIPMTFLDSEVSQLVTYLTTVQPGMAVPWVTNSVTGPGVFPFLYTTMGNENWNQTGATYGTVLSYRGGAAQNKYEDAINRTGQMIKAMRANANYTPNIKLGFTGQAVDTYGISSGNGSGTPWGHMAATGGAPDYVELEAYRGGLVTDFDTELDQWIGELEQPEDRFANASNARHQQMAAVQTTNLCGPSGTAACIVTIYEQGEGSNDSCHPTNDGSGVLVCGGVHAQPATAAALTQTNVGAGNALAASLAANLEMDNGIPASNYFAMTGYGGAGGGAASSLYAHLWHNTVDFGGACSAANSQWNGFCPDPSEIGMSMFNSAVIGSKTSCTNSGPTYTYPGSNNGESASFAGAHYIFSACFTDGSGHFSMVVWNTDQVNPYRLNFAGTNVPTGTVTVRTLAPSSLNLTNESLGSTDTSSFAPQVNSTTTTLTSPTSDVIAPHAMKVYLYSTAATVPPVSKQSTGAVFSSGAVSELRPKPLSLYGSEAYGRK